MNIEDIRAYCKKLPKATEDVKWESDLCFCIGGKIFCSVPLEGELRVTFKVRDDEFDELTTIDGFIPAPYIGRYKWVSLIDVSIVKRKQLEAYIFRSYEMIKAKLPRKLLK